MRKKYKADFRPNFASLDTSIKALIASHLKPNTILTEAAQTEFMSENNVV